MKGAESKSAPFSFNETKQEAPLHTACSPIDEVCKKKISYYKEGDSTYEEPQIIEL